MTNFLSKIGLTRDSAWWLAGIIASVIVGIAAFNESMWTFAGLPAAMIPYLPWFRFGALVIGISSGKLSFSPLAQSGQLGIHADPAKTLTAFTGSTKLPMVLLAAALAGATMPACASAPPKGTYSTVGEHAWQADQLLKDLTAVSQTAINLNAQPIGTREHLSDRDTALVRDYSLVAGAALNAYGSGATTLEAARVAVRMLALPPGLAKAAAAAFDRAAAAYGNQASVLHLVVDTFTAFQATLSADANQNPKLLAALATIAAAVNSIPIP